ncbi:hypothetical protein ABT390_26165 [Streptomyces aurantiacus]|uniref:Secreted protein n=1 Tax=Streptomyces aurantiacus JA 4570 TaxID=1286094 RepID=S3ZKN3_9ACTN|nr:hypothetical protein [Streptomyces aurantiacus]EPH43753.1 hypothetical protein STRAU_3176 [Streptomyces aurantiacus JA 4570]
MSQRMAVIAGSVLAAALVLSGCGSDDDDGGGNEGGSGSAAAEAKVLAKVAQPKVGEMAGAMGMWTTDKNFVKAGLKKISGYPLAGGKAEWEVPLTGEVCWSSETPTKDGKVAVVFQNDKKDPSVCTEIGVVDINKGKLLWHKQATNEYGSAEMFDEITVGGGTVAAAGTSASAGWKLDGTPLWKPSDETCDTVGYAGDETKLVAVRDCGDTDNPKLQVETVDPKTRAAKSTYKLPQGTEYVHVAAVDPLVLAADDGKSQGGSGISRFITVDDSAAQGKELSTIPVGGGKHGKYEADCPATEVTGCAQLAVSKAKNALYLGTSDPASSSSEAKNDLVSFDLRTGKQLRRAPGSDSGRLVPIGVDDSGKVIAYEEANIAREAGGAIHEVDPATLKQTKVLQHPSDSYEMEARFESDRRTLYSGGRFYLGADHVTEPSTVYKTPQPLAVVYGEK